MWIAGRAIEAGVSDTVAPDGTPAVAHCPRMSIRDIFPGATPSGSPQKRDVPDSRFGRILVAARAVERELWFTVVVAMLLDVTLTVHGLTIGLVEANPVARYALDTAGILGLYALKLAAIGIGLACRAGIDDRYAAVVPLGLAVPSLVAVVINTTLIATVTL